MKKTLLRSLLAVLVIAMLLPAAALAADDGIQVTVDGEAVVWTDAVPFIDENNRTLVPLRAVADAMGLDVSWDQENRTATFSLTRAIYDADLDVEYQSIRSISFTLDSIYASTIDDSVYPEDYEENSRFNGDYIEMDTAAVILDGRTYAPIRYLAEFFGCAVDWDSQNRTVVIIAPETYMLYWETFCVMPDHVGIYFRPGEDFRNFASLEVLDARVNGISVPFVLAGEEEAAGLSEMLGGAISPFRIYYNFEQTSVDPETGEPSEPYLIEWDQTYTYADGSVSEVPQTLVWELNVSGYGGI